MPAKHGSTASQMANAPPQAKNGPPVQLKPTDQTIPASMSANFPQEVRLFKELQTRERMLDMMINRKMLDLQEYQQKLGQLEMSGDLQEETLRIFIYNTSEHQPWQGTNGESPMWTLRVEGRLLGDTKSLDDSTRHKMSWFLSGLSIELKPADGDYSVPLNVGAVLQQDGPGSSDMIVEWHDDPKIPEPERVAKQFDGMDIKRAGLSIPNGSGNERQVMADIVIQPKSFPIKLKVINESLIILLGKSEITQTECIKMIFWYAKINGLFEVKEDEKSVGDSQQPKKNIIIKADELLMKIFGLQTITTAQVLEIVGRNLLKPIDPIRILYPIDTLKSSTLGDVIVDIKVNKSILEGHKPVIKDMEDITRIITEEILDRQSMSDLRKLDENLKLNIQLLNYSKMKYDFYDELSKDPAGFLKLVLEKNEEYLSILTSDDMSFGKNGLIDEELVRRSDFYSDEFLRQHINVLFNSGRI
ncbi:Snf12 protein [Martiniozyma asiatica (nom. inval.)]|nr:Snf12 protein [Martiniozyma asiatica]